MTPDSPGAVHDIDQDGDVDETDLDWLVQAYESPESGNADCNGNGVADVRDIARGTSADADADGVPDDCASCTGDLDSNGSVNGQDLGMLLTPELAFAGTDATPPPIGPQAPGDLTRWMGLPWQGDAFSCQQVVFPNDFPIASWWPALVTSK